MCGIVGIWNHHSQRIDQSVLNRFTDSLSHRGPDGRGVMVEEDVNLGLGHRRLAIID